MVTAGVSGALLLAGCGASSSSEQQPEGPAASGTSAAAARCQANKDAGEITFLTGYGYFPSASVIEVITASEKGFFAEQCLDVKVVPSLPGQSSVLLNANKIQFNATDMGSVAASFSQGANIPIVLNLGNLPIDNLIVKDDSPITDLQGFRDSVIGIGGSYLGAPVQAMLATAGLQKNADYKTANIGYDVMKLTSDRISAEAGYRSSNVQTLEAGGVKVREFLPEDYGVPGSFAAIGTNDTFIREHPTAVEDFVRAVLKGLEYAYDPANLDEIIGFTKAKTEGDFDWDHEVTRFKIESDLVQKGHKAGTPYGEIDPELFKSVVDNLVTYKVLKSAPPVDQMYNNTFVDAVAPGGNLIWPGPVAEGASPSAS